MANLNINKSVIGGRLTADAELKTTSSGVSVCSFAVAVTRKMNREEVDFINCVAWRNTAEFISKYFRKGSSICLTGSIQTRNWTDNGGNKRFTTEFVAEEAYFVDSKSDNAFGQQSAPLNGAPHFEEIDPDSELPF